MGECSHQLLDRRRRLQAVLGQGSGDVFVLVVTDTVLVSGGQVLGRWPSGYEAGTGGDREGPAGAILNQREAMVLTSDDLRVASGMEPVELLIELRVSG